MEPLTNLPTSEQTPAPVSEQVKQVEQTEQTPQIKQGSKLPFVTKVKFSLFGNRRKSLASLAVLVIFIGGSVAGYFYFQKNSEKTKAQLLQQTPQDVYSAFIEEGWDIIKTNYWDKIDDEKLSNLFKLATEKVSKNPETLTSSDKTGVTAMIRQATRSLENDKKKEFVTATLDIVLANLQPFGRSRLYGQKEEKQLRDTVTNVNPENDLYATVGASKSASSQEIDKSYEQKVAPLENKTNKTAEEIQQLEKIKYAYQVLTNKDQKQTYDKVGAEPTVFSKMISPKVAYISIKKVSPQTFEEFQKVANEIKDGPDSLILDLRKNIGGAIDILPYFLGPFIGKDQYAYDFFHQGEYTPYKTKIGWLPSLVKYKKVVILTDADTQSSAEVMAATFKKYNVGIVIGIKTKGWGTIEQLMPLKTQLDPLEKYSILMVHSLTISDDGQPIESRGVEPTISIEDKNWPKELLSYFNYPELVDAVKKAWEIK